MTIYIYEGRNNLNKIPLSYSLKQIIFAYKQEHPDWDEKKIKREALKLQKEIQKMDKQWERSNEKFYSHNELIGDWEDVE